MNLTIDKNLMNAVYADMAKAAKEIFEKHGLKYYGSTCRANPVEMTLKLVGTVENASERRADDSKNFFEARGLESGFVLVNGKEFRLVKQRRGGKTWEVIDREGKSWRMDTGFVMAAFRKKS